VLHSVSLYAVLHNKLSWSVRVAICAICSDLACLIASACCIASTSTQAVSNSACVGCGIVGLYQVNCQSIISKSTVCIKNQLICNIACCSSLLFIIFY